MDALRFDPTYNEKCVIISMAIFKSDLKNVKTVTLVTGDG
jgi:hypothetical protein